MFLPLFDLYIRGKVDAGTARQYVAKTAKLLNYFEATVPDFKMDFLVFAAEAGFPLLPGLGSYLSYPKASRNIGIQACRQNSYVQF